MSEEGSAAEYPKWDYQEYPKTLPRDDFWGQVRRTIMGQRISEEDLALLVDHIRGQLQLRSSDILLDIGCGNGALSARLFDECAGYAGADLSPYLIEVAHEFFEQRPDYRFFECDAAEFVRSVDDPERFTKGLCFAAVQYMPLGTVQEMLQILWERFEKLVRVVLGNLPNRERAHLFFTDHYSEDDLAQYRSQIGKWWSKDEIGSLASSFGWQVEFTHLSEAVFNAKYRFNAVLTRA